jgi:hypothetical protein
MASIGQTTFSAIYEIAPIWLQNGIAQAIGGYAPITLITEIIDYPGLSNKEFFAHYKPLPGGTLSDWQIAEYPFANFATAANAVVQQPLNISMLMVCPAQTNGGYLFKQAILTALQLSIQTHISTGGTFTVITPAYTYFNCLLKSIRDITPASDKQVQYMFQWDFSQPLITASAAESIQGTLMNAVTNGLPTTTSWTNPLGLAPGEVAVP